MAQLRGARIDELFAYVTIDGEDDIEGVVTGFDMGLGAPIPLVGADIERMLSYRSAAEEAAAATGQTIKLVRFTSRQEIETIDGD